MNRSGTAQSNQHSSSAKGGLRSWISRIMKPKIKLTQHSSLIHGPLLRMLTLNQSASDLLDSYAWICGQCGE